MVGCTHRFAFGLASNPSRDFFVVLKKVVQMGCDICRIAAYGAHRIAVVAVVEQDVGVFLKSFELLRCAGALAIVVYAFAYCEVLSFATNDGTKSYGGNNYDRLASETMYAV